MTGERSSGISRSASCAATGSAIIGANGAGKTTLINLLTGARRAGRRRGAARSERAHGEPRPEAGDRSQPAATLVDALTGGGSDYVTINGERRHVIGYMKDFLFAPEQARTPIGKLSGGERGRLMLARALAAPSNLLVLDEPTNDLDIETLDLLQELLADYPGTVLLVSHDRDFLDRVATSVIVSEGGGRWIEYAGGYSDMVAQRGYGLAGPLASPAGEAPAKAGRPREPSQPRRSENSASTRSARSNGCRNAWTPCGGARRARAQTCRPRFRRAGARGVLRRRPLGTGASARTWKRRRTNGCRSKFCARALSSRNE